MKKILIRADGGKGIGMGHIMRMLILSKELSKTCEVVFLCKNDKADRYLNGINNIKKRGFKVIEIEDENFIENIINIQMVEKADLLITDSYNVDEKYFKIMKKYFNKTAYMYDFNIGRVTADFIINQNINAEQIKINCNNDAKLLIGTKYLLLREEFRNFNREKLNSEVSNVILTVGGMDDDYLTLKIIELLSDFNFNLHVVIGGSFEKVLVEKINSFKSNKLKIIIYENAVMSEIMEICDLAISGCGSTLYELGAMKVPIIGIVIAENQRDIAEFMGEKNMIINTQNSIYINEYKFLDNVKHVVYNYKSRKEMVHNLGDVIKTNGTENLVLNILEQI